jgi:hypothetical protein
VLADIEVRHLFGYAAGGKVHFTMAVVVFVALFVVLLAMAAIFVEVLSGAHEDDEYEKEVAQIVSGRSVTPPDTVAADSRLSTPTVLARSSHWRPAEPVEALADEETVGPPTFVQPTRVERQALPISSLPFEWLQMTAVVPRPNSPVWTATRSGSLLIYLDGVSMLLELALQGLVDVPPASRRRTKDKPVLIIGTEASGNAAFDGALSRLRAFDGPLEPQSAGIRLAPYIGALVVPAVGARPRRETIQDAIVGDGATDIRTALLVWMLKQDQVLGGGISEAIFSGHARAMRPALRRVNPDLYGLADHDVAAAAHRVLYSTLLPLAPAGVW